MPPSPSPDPRAAYHAHLDAFFPGDAAGIKFKLERAVDRAAERAQVARDVVWQALCGGLHEWMRQRLISWTIQGSSPSPAHDTEGNPMLGPDDPQQWLLNRGVDGVIREHRKAITHLKALEGWAKEFDDAEGQQQLADMRAGIEDLIANSEGWKASTGRRAGQNWSAWMAARACLVAAGVVDPRDLSKLRKASALGRPDPELPA